MKVEPTKVDAAIKVEPTKVGAAMKVELTWKIQDFESGGLYLMAKFLYSHRMHTYSMLDKHQYLNPPINMYTVTYINKSYSVKAFLFSSAVGGFPTIPCQPLFLK